MCWEQWSWSNGLFGAVIGGLLAGGFTLLGVMLSHKKETDRELAAEKAIIEAVVQSIRVEVEVLWNRYKGTAGSHLVGLREGEIFGMFYPISHDYFTIYNANSGMIGKVPDSALRASIVRTYTLAKALLDTYLFNNKILEELQYMQLHFLETNNQVHGSRVQAITEVMKQAAVLLRQLHEDVESSVEEMLRLSNRGATT